MFVSIHLVASLERDTGLLHCTLCLLVQTTMNTIVISSEDTVTLECLPSISCLNIHRIWTYTALGGSGNLTNLEVVYQLRIQSTSPLLYQLVLLNADVSDAGYYTCIVKSSFDNAIIFNHTISLTVIPGN